MTNIFGYIKESINEGDGLRTVIFISGCHGNCDECQNPESWDFNYGYPFTKELQSNIIKQIKDNPLIQGITLCGGEPFMSAKPLTKFIKMVKEEIPHLTYWSFTGFEFENILENKDQLGLLKELDVIIDGAFVKELKDLTLKFRGSSNQRIIDVQKSLKTENVVLLDI